MNISEMSDVLQEKKEILTNELNDKVTAFIEFANEKSPVVKILSGEEILKSKLLIELATEDRINISGQYVTDGVLDAQELLFVDYIVIISSALRISPINLKNYLEHIRIHGKRCFIIVDNWAMIPKNKVNIKKIQAEIAKDYPMVDVFETYMISESEVDGFVALKEASQKICDRICRLYEETHKVQVNSIYKSLRKEIELEMTQLEINALKNQNQLEIMRNNLSGMEKANRIKFDNIRDVFNNYSIDMLEDLKFISLEECLKEDEEFSNYREVKASVNAGYVELVKSVFTKRNQVVLQEYKKRLEKFRENLLVEILAFYNKVEKNEMCDKDFLKKFNQQMYEVASVDEIILKVSAIVEDALNDLLKKITVISKKTMMEEMEFSQSVIDKLKKLAEQKLQEKIDEEEEKLKREKIIRTQLENSIRETNMKLFEENDRFIENMKKAILALSNEVVGIYYSKLQKTLLEMESQIEKRYRSR